MSAISLSPSPLLIVTGCIGGCIWTVRLKFWIPTSNWTNHHSFFSRCHTAWEPFTWESLAMEVLLLQRGGKCRSHHGILYLSCFPYLLLAASKVVWASRCFFSAVVCQPRFDRKRPITNHQSQLHVSTFMSNLDTFWREEPLSKYY